MLAVFDERDSFDARRRQVRVHFAGDRRCTDVVKRGAADQSRIHVERPSLSDAAVEDEVGAVASAGTTSGSTSFVGGFIRTAPTVVGDDDAVGSVLHRKRRVLRSTVYEFEYDLGKVAADNHLRISDCAATNESRHWNRRA